jgi:hypothetical protein
MDKLDDLKAELKAMERLAKLLHELPTEDSVVRVAAWLNEVMRTDMFKPHDAVPAVATIEGLLGNLSSSELVHIQSLISHMPPFAGNHDAGEIDSIAASTRIGIEELPGLRPFLDNSLAQGIKSAQGIAPKAELEAVKPGL